VRARWPAAVDRRRALDAALAANGPIDPLVEGGATRVQAWLANPAAPPVAGRIELALASNDPDDLTLREARLLGTADCILFEPTIAPAILDRARADAARLPLPHEGAIPEGLVLVLCRKS
jgi:uroporphyrin-III C-methyltransferase/precorrin-2 dehydrogenase/sirohydrochlorin ferrochelatase